MRLQRSQHLREPRQPRVAIGFARREQRDHTALRGARDLVDGVERERLGVDLGVAQQLGERPALRLGELRPIEPEHDHRRQLEIAQEAQVDRHAVGVVLDRGGLDRDRGEALALARAKQPQVELSVRARADAGQKLEHGLRRLERVAGLRLTLHRRTLAPARSAQPPAELAPSHRARCDLRAIRRRLREAR